MRVVKVGLVITLLATSVATLVGCGNFTNAVGLPTPTNDPSQYRTPVPTVYNYIPPYDVAGYSHHAPSEMSLIRLEFDYPTYWFLNEYVSDSGFTRIVLGDPRFLNLPTQPPPDELHPTPNDFGIVEIGIIPSKPGRTVESEAEDQKTLLRNVGWATFLNDYKIAIDGFGARVIEHQIMAPEIHTSLMFERQIYFFAENEIYTIRFLVAEKDRGGNFEQGYEYFINSVKVVREK